MDVDEILTEHLQPAFTACVVRLRTAYNTFAPVSTDQDLLWNAPPHVRGAWTSFRHGANDYEQLRTAWHMVRAGQPALLDHEGLFSEVANLEHVWAERTSGLRPASQMVPPWPPRRDVLPWLLWMFAAGAELHLPTAAEQDTAWSRVFGARAAEFAAGDRHVGQMREIFAG